MTATTPITAAATEHANSRPAAPRFGGVLWRLARLTSPLTMPMAGKHWNPIFAVVEHRGRRSGRRYTTPVAARRIADGFVISLAFGAQVDWYRNLLAAKGGTIRWRGRPYAVSTPEMIDAADALAAFHAVQRLLLRVGRVHGFVVVRDALRREA
jgi:deazaflavin-dependent oxidoreductase (nitroreductase family)